MLKRGFFALWEGPQNLLGAAIYLGLRLAGAVVDQERDRERLFVETKGLGVSLGWFVFWSRSFADGFADASFNRAHEFGHSVQSRWLGPSYLLVVGLPSVSRVIYSWTYHRLTGRSWNGYYDGWPENHADRLGGVVRARGSNP